MRWEELFGDLEGQWEAAHDAAFSREVTELATAERASVDLAARLAASGGEPVVAHLRGGDAVRGVVADVTPSWLLLTDGPRDHLIPAGALAAVSGVGGRSLPWGGVDGRLGLGYALRALAESGVAVVVATDGGEFRGTIVGVGADHVDLAPEGSAEPIAVAFGSIRRVSSA